MKKKVFAAIGAMAVAGTIGFAFSQSGVVNADPNLSRDDIRDQVTKEYPGTITELELDKKGKKAVYEVEIELEGKEYDLKIDGDTGEVLKLEEKVISPSTTPKSKSDDKKGDQADDKQSTEDIVVKEKKESTSKDNVDDDKGNKADAKTDDKDDQAVDTKSKDNNDDKANAIKKDANNSSTKKAVIGSEQAEKIALENFKGTIKELELDEDDDHLVYEIEIVNGNSEADIEIDAYTGEVLVLEIETEDDED